MHPVLCQFSSHAVGVHVHNHHHNHIRIGIVVVVIVVIIVVVVIVVVLTVDCRDNGVSGEDCGAHHVQHVERVRPAIGQHVQHDQDPPPPLIAKLLRIIYISFTASLIPKRPFSAPLSI